MIFYVVFFWYLSVNGLIVIYDAFYESMHFDKLLN